LCFSLRGLKNKAFSILLRKNKKKQTDIPKDIDLL
jgi:hypothetical protein